MTTYDLNAVVTARIDVSPELIILRVAPDGWKLPDFKPGQWAVLGLPASAPRSALSDPEEAAQPPDKLLRRTYSIASSSASHEFVEFYLNIVRSGELSPRLFELHVGDKVWMSPAFSGMFHLADVPGDRDIVMIATGTGLAPYMSMIRSQLHAENNRRIILLHGARHTWDLGFRSELISLQRICPQFAYIPVVSRPGEEPVAWHGESGYVQDLWTRGAVPKAWGRKPAPEDTHIFLCGNPAMAEEMVGILAVDGFREHTPETPGQVHLERFW
jgi:ferredoxin--NADP+ reductase